MLAQDFTTTRRLLYNLAIHLFAFYAVTFLTWFLASNVARAEQELEAKSEEMADLEIKYRDVIQSITSGLITTDRAGIVTSLNRAGQQILHLGGGGDHRPPRLGDRHHLPRAVAAVPSLGRRRRPAGERDPGGPRAGADLRRLLAGPARGRRRPAHRQHHHLPGPDPVAEARGGGPDEGPHGRRRHPRRRPGPRDRQPARRDLRIGAAAVAVGRGGVAPAAGWSASCSRRASGSTGRSRASSSTPGRSSPRRSRSTSPGCCRRTSSCSRTARRCCRSTA